VADLARLVREKYPGTYDSLTDDDLERRVTTKFPVYRPIVEAERIRQMRVKAGLSAEVSKPPVPGQPEEMPPVVDLTRPEAEMPPLVPVRPRPKPGVRGWLEAVTRGDPAEAFRDVFMLPGVGGPLPAPRPVAPPETGGAALRQVGARTLESVATPTGVARLVGGVAQFPLLLARTALERGETDDVRFEI